MDTDHVIFSANADSLDSWDIENLKFLRKISIKDPNRKCDMETLSYVSERESLSQIYPECEALLETAIYTSGSERIVKQQIKEVPTGTALLIPRDDVSEVTTSTSLMKESSPSRQRVISKLPTIDMNNNLLIPQLVQISSSCPKPRKSIFESLDMTVTISSTNPVVLHQNQKPLEDCYVMDVLMVRNESVLTDNNSKKTSSPAFRTPPQLLQVVALDDDEQDKPESNTPDSIRKEMTLLRYSSSSPASMSSEDSFASAIEKGFFEMEKTGSEGSSNSKEGRNSPITLEIHQQDIPSEQPSSITSTVQYIRKSQMRHQRPDECPFCGSCTRANSFTYASRREDLNETEGVSLVPTVGGEPPPIHLQTSTPPAPHLLQKSSSFSPHPPPPYYVQLREGLPTAAFLSTVSSNTLKPHNFSHNKRGLVIDYSSNWEGLESYVKNLTLSTAVMRKKSMKSLLSRKSN